jgi:protein required for attachment to host cells
MSDYCVVTVDGVRARFFCLEPVKQPAVESGPNLVEHREALINTELELSGRELWTDNKTGRNAANGMAHGYDDHRDQHTEEFKRRFAKQVADEALQIAQFTGAKKLVVAAEKQMLGYLRTALHVSPKAGFEVCELAKDLSRLSPQELQGHLAAEGLVPPRQRPG